MTATPFNMFEYNVTGAVVDLETVRKLSSHFYTVKTRALAYAEIIYPVPQFLSGIYTPTPKSVLEGVVVGDFKLKFRPIGGGSGSEVRGGFVDQLMGSLGPVSIHSGSSPSWISSITAPI
ncbi:uncharacterized protein LOC112090586 [Morus notabilis]|uniref:uncharacterized protein LOC112090586 n=1 Tax=Morus notabilis TaxID=981085 RepID=UPI000CED36A0|nr:uncharacterized protein LOC112090586 [Morus notabilis]